MRLHRKNIIDVDYSEADDENPERVILTTKRGWAFEPADDASAARHTKSFETTAEANERTARLGRCRCNRCKS